VAALGAAALLAASGCGGGDHGPIRIGVMLPLTGPEAVGAEAPLRWAQDNVNAAGGVDGRPIRFVFRDLARRSPLAVAREFAADASIKAVIGPQNSEDARQVTTILANHDKVAVTPSATSADLFRAWKDHRPQYVWRPVQSDIGQVRVMLELAAARGARSVALVAGDTPFGNTFFDWFGFLATEKGLRVTSTVRYDQQANPCEPYLDDALSGHPDAVLAVPDHAPQAICMARRFRTRGSPGRLILADAAQRASVIRALGPQARGLEGTGLAPAPGNGFARAYKARSGERPPPYAANTYDAVLLLAYGLRRSGGKGGADLARAIAAVTAGRGPALGWDRAAVAQALHAIGAGQTPAIRGAVGPWSFDRASGIELVGSTYEHWRVQRGRFAVQRYVSTANNATARAGFAAERTPATRNRARAPAGGTYRPGRKTGTWALLVAASDGWQNYRHQADVLAQYQRVRAGGVPDDHIVLVSANDLADNPRNPHRGSVPYTPDGPNLDRGVRVDYPLQGMTAERLMQILSGQRSAENPTVIASGPGDDVFVYLAGHGNQKGLYLGLGAPVPNPTGSYSVLTPDGLDQTVATIASQHRYRQLLIAVEACQGGALGQGLDARGALLLSAANPVENSLSANYDPAAGTWLADQFSYELWRAEAATPSLSLDRLYERLYLHVAGSHISAYGPRFGAGSTATIGEFLTP
jgi:ABC-type branched-subunit amino acid transport system substrate-binding protein